MENHHFEWENSHFPVPTRWWFISALCYLDRSNRWRRQGHQARPGESSKDFSIIFRPFTIQAWRRGMVVQWSLRKKLGLFCIFPQMIYNIYIYTLSILYLSIYLYLYISIYIYIWNLWLPSYLWPVWEMETSHFIHVAAIRCCSSAKPFWVKQLIFLMWWNAAVCCLLETSLGMPHYM